MTSRFSYICKLWKAFFRTRPSPPGDNKLFYSPDDQAFSLNEPTPLTSKLFLHQPQACNLLIAKTNLSMEEASEVLDRNITK
jgi:hypothetical protein